MQLAKEGVLTAEESKLKVKGRKALAIICLRVEEDLKNILHEATFPFEAWTLLKNSFKPSNRTRIAALKRQFIQVKFDTTLTMSDQIRKFWVLLKT